MTKTAVTQLIEQVILQGILIDDLDIHSFIELEKEQIKDAYKDGFATSLFMIDKSDSEYYNTKFK